MDLGLKGRHAIICASSKGLGKACAIALADEGCSVTLNGRTKETLESTAKEITDRCHVEVNVVVADVSTFEGQNELLKKCPQPDILINNNGGPPLRDFKELDRNKILSGITQNMVTPIELIQAVIDGMRERKFGRIINITSTSIYAPILGLDLSSGARAGLTSFLAGIARTVVRDNVTINNLLPGPFATDRLLKTFNVNGGKENSINHDLIEERKKQNPAQRFGEPDEFGHACTFLCSEKSGFITGQNIILDGGAYISAF
ncbi:SDR family oxidoreductase [Bartonella tamiae]|uniref:3-oxoacyl-[acyl-carrier-protein] reductase n=1 Tax=Bartonella tamiae Th239 TaxID=1094558 RepID=J1JW57_9HYPH|nr:SDR family oxidoreductase [Bartonella tamiae]EJF88815.1 hypothetical protein ME5_01366 [Bartonella tamiae Th239]EJF94935.1 hypothetical protein MEG_00516 [Bartonella tamiae Th307]